VIIERRAPPMEDLATVAANLLLRLGIIALAIVVPCAAVIHRRPLLVMMPVGEKNFGVTFAQPPSVVILVSDWGV